ncbi:MAG: hypothetical protein EHM20_11610 [Alphaproteobacteria bacterium]|nr:MAG: hypothetical protein EHM20_11610 [Alphaproteobacteria bacterium]
MFYNAKELGGGRGFCGYHACAAVVIADRFKDLNQRETLFRRETTEEGANPDKAKFIDTPKTGQRQVVCGLNILDQTKCNRCIDEKDFEAWVGKVSDLIKGEVAQTRAKILEAYIKTKNRDLFPIRITH